MNRLDKALAEKILELSEKGLSMREISRELGLHRKTVRGTIESVPAGDSKCTSKNRDEGDKLLPYGKRTHFPKGASYTFFAMMEDRWREQSLRQQK